MCPKRCSSFLCDQPTEGAPRLTPGTPLGDGVHDVVIRGNPSATDPTPNPKIARRIAENSGALVMFTAPGVSKGRPLVKSCKTRAPKHDGARANLRAPSISAPSNQSSNGSASLLVSNK